MAEPHESFDALRAMMPGGSFHRNAIMDALARRAVLAYLDAQPDTLAAVIERVGTWDDTPREFQYPQTLPRYRFAGQRALAIVNQAFMVADQAGIEFQDAMVMLGARRLVTDLAPEAHRREALEILRTGKKDAAGIELRPDAADGPAGLVAFAATAAHLYGNPRLFRSQHAVRTMFDKQIRELEAEAYQMPDLERVADISDQDARAFLLHLLPGFPLSPLGEPTLPELEIIQLIKRHLLSTHADATTADQQEELLRCVRVILSTSLEAREAKKQYAAPASSFPGRPRQQPRRKQPKAKRK
ncbi:MAG TPA: hypothetical protein VL551_10575 [Actinospica sp.]|jgi:hypothetical protein|nr:hypothetical protein [Actinospica sp.]